MKKEIFYTLALVGALLSARGAFGHTIIVGNAMTSGTVTFDAALQGTSYSPSVTVAAGGVGTIDTNVNPNWVYVDYCVKGGTMWGPSGSVNVGNDGLACSNQAYIVDELGYVHTGNYSQTEVGQIVAKIGDLVNNKAKGYILDPGT